MLILPDKGKPAYAYAHYTKDETILEVAYHVRSASS